MIELIAGGAALGIIVRSTCIAAHLSRRDFVGHELRFYILAISYAFTAGGALGVLLGLTHGPLLLLVGVSGFFFAERRLAGKPRFS